MDKKKYAINVVNRVRTMEHEKLCALIKEEATEELADFFFAYSANLLMKDPARMVENGSSLMLLGYLVGRLEGRQSEAQPPAVVVGLRN